MVDTPVPPSLEKMRALLEQQATLAAFGHQALLTDDLDALLQEAARLVAQGLDTDYSKVMEYLPEQNKLLLRAGIGWDPATIGVATFDTERSSATGHAIATGRPVISEDINHDSRFQTPDFLRQYGITSSVNALIRGQRNSIFGVLQCDSRMRRDFDEHDTDFLQNFANILAAAIARTNLRRQLSAALDENAALRRELQSQRHAQFT